MRGFYVDLGASLPRQISNTYFFDACLGWRGLCIEADPALAAGLRESSRTCTVVNMCAGERGAVSFTTKGAFSGHVSQDGQGTVVQCAPLEEILQMHNVSSVDYMAVDIEGNEVEALGSVDWDAVPIQLVLTETMWSNEMLDMLLHDGGYWRVADVGYGDDVYIRAPKLVKSRHMDTRHRNSNWEYVSNLRLNYKASPMHLPVDERPDGDKVLYTRTGFKPNQ